MEKMELSEALKANASVLEELIGVATSEKDGLIMWQKILKLE